MQYAMILKHICNYFLESDCYYMKLILYEIDI